MIDEKIIAPDTNEEHFFFVFGYGEDGFENFKPIKILKPNTNYKRESGKRTIIYLLKELMGYSDDEIRPTLGKNRHLVINSCFEVSPLFKSSDFGDIPASEASEIIKASELLKLDRKVMIITDAGVPIQYAEKIASQSKEAYIKVD